MKVTMRNNTPGFNGRRLIQARDVRQLSQLTLAEIIGKASSAVSRWEKGGHTPEPETLQKLAAALNVPASYFLTGFEEEQSPFFYRSMSSATLSGRKRLKARLEWVQDVLAYLQSYLDFPEVDIPCHGASDFCKIFDSDIEELASACRERWGLGHGPISDVILVMENAGVCVVREEVGSDKLDGLSNWTTMDGRPFVHLASDKNNCVRSRMDAAHELGHLVLHRNLDVSVLNDTKQFKEIERQAFRFAGAFLMPQESFSAEIWTPTLSSFLSLKERWKVAVAAMIKRSQDLGIVDDRYATRLWKHISSKGWRHAEPLDDVLIPEKPRLLARSINLLVDEGVVRKEEIVSEMRLSEIDIELLCGLPLGFFSSGSADVLIMPTLKSETASRHSSSGEDTVVTLDHFRK